VEPLPKDLTELNAREQRLRGEIKQSTDDAQEACLREQRALEALEIEGRAHQAANDRLAALLEFRDRIADHAAVLIRNGGRLLDAPPLADESDPVEIEFSSFGEQVAAE
jgi:hypothetical protein